MGTSFFNQRQYADCYQHSLLLPISGTFFEIRAVNPGAAELTSLYPRLVQRDVAHLQQTIAELATLDGFVAMVAATDPTTVSADDLASVAAQLDHLVRFKTHYVIDRRIGIEYSVHHRREVDRARKRGEYREEPLAMVLDEWMQLYQHLAERHVIRSPFSPDWFARLGSVSGTRFYSHRVDGRLVGASIWAFEQRRGYYMFSAAASEGYRAGSHYGLIDYAVAVNPDIEIFDLGGNPGIDDSHHGLSRFKSGFSNRHVDSFLIGKILDRQGYEALAVGRSRRFFPAYRA